MYFNRLTLEFIFLFMGYFTYSYFALVNGKKSVPFNIEADRWTTCVATFTKLARDVAQSLEVNLCMGSFGCRAVLGKIHFHFAKAWMLIEINFCRGDSCLKWNISILSMFSLKNFHFLLRNNYSEKCCVTCITRVDKDVKIYCQFLLAISFGSIEDDEKNSAKLVFSDFSSLLMMMAKAIERVIPQSATYVRTIFG